MQKVIMWAVIGAVVGGVYTFAKVLLERNK